MTNRDKAMRLAHLNLLERMKTATQCIQCSKDVKTPFYFECNDGQHFACQNCIIPTGAAFCPGQQLKCCPICNKGKPNDLPCRQTANITLAVQMLYRAFGLVPCQQERSLPHETTTQLLPDMTDLNDAREMNLCSLIMLESLPDNDPRHKQIRTAVIRNQQIVQDIDRQAYGKRKKKTCPQKPKSSTRFALDDNLDDDSWQSQSHQTCGAHSPTNCTTADESAPDNHATRQHWNAGSGQATRTSPFVHSSASGRKRSHTSQFPPGPQEHHSGSSSSSFFRHHATSKRRKKDCIEKFTGGSAHSATKRKVHDDRPVKRQRGNGYVTSSLFHSTSSTRSTHPRTSHYPDDAKEHPTSGRVAAVPSIRSVVTTNHQGGLADISDFSRIRLNDNHSSMFSSRKKKRIGIKRR